MPATPGVDADAALRRRRRWWRRLVPAAAIVSAVVVVEIGLRVRAEQVDRVQWGSNIDDDQRGWALRPGFRGWTDTEGRVWVEINRDGMRDHDHDTEKPAGTVRVAVLGDSFMQAVNVPVEKAFTSFLEQRLADCAEQTSRQAEVLNFGVGGYGTAQELLTYRHHASRYHPDIVLLALYTGNDIFNNHRELNERNEIPYFVLRGDRVVLDEPQKAPPSVDSSPVEPMPWYQQIRTSITSRSMTAGLVWSGYALLRSPFVATQVVDVMRRDARPIEKLRALYRPVSTPLMDQAWAVTEALVSTLAREVAERGGEFWLVTLSNSEQVEPDLSRRRAFADLMSVDDLFYPDRRLRDYARAQGINVISLAEPLAAHAAAHGVFLNGGTDDEAPPGTGHWNELANQLAAGMVSERLCTESASLAREQ